MKRFYFLFTILATLTFVFSNCTNTENLSYDTVFDRVTGKWTIEKVKLKDNKKLYGTDITDIYKDFTFDFKFDNTLEIYNAREDKTLYGYWYLNEDLEWDNSDQEYDVKYEIYTIAYDLSDTTQYREMTWKDLRVNNNRLSAIEKRVADDGERHKYSYELKR